MWRALILAVLAGLAIGVGSRAGHQLSEPIDWAMALGAPWLVLAGLVGALARDKATAALAGAGALVVGVGTYYAVFLLVEHSTSPYYAVLNTFGWSLAAAAAGAAFGYAGAVWREGRGWRPSVAVAAVAGALVGEAVLLLTFWDSPAARRILAAELIAGALLPLVLARDGRGRVLATGLTVVAAATVFVGETAVRVAMRRAGWAGA